MPLYEEEERYRGGHQGGPFVHLVLVVSGEWPTQARVSKCPTTTTTCTFSSSQAATNAAADALNAEALLSRGAHSNTPSTFCDSLQVSGTPPLKHQEGVSLSVPTLSCSGLR